MAINFTKNVEQYTMGQKSARVKHFMEFTSKKQLQDAGVLPEETLEFAKSIKGTFNYALHEDLRYMAVTLYKANGGDRKYNFLVLDLQEQAIAEANSIREAKAEILELAMADRVQKLIQEELGDDEVTDDAPESEDDIEDEEHEEEQE